MSEPNGPPDSAARADRILDAALADTVRRTGASAGIVYLPDAGHGGDAALRLVAVCGMPAEIVAPWKHVPLAAELPVTDALRDGALVWVGSQEELARRYPRAAAVLPYRFALAAAPMDGARGRHGVLLLLWPAGRPGHAGARERAHLTAGARRIAHRVEEAPGAASLPDRPRTVPAARPGPPPRSAAHTAATDFAERLPGGSLALDLEGRITFITNGAADLLGRPADQLMGLRPWQALPWLDDPIHEEKYRAAVISREPIAFTALHPSGTPLDVRLFPDTSGISVRITPRPGGRQPPDAASGDDGSEARRAPATATATASSAGRLYQLAHLAAALTEAVSVADVAGLVAGQVLPAFGAQGLVLSTADAGRLRITGHHGYPAETIRRLDGLPLDTTLTPAGQVIADGTPAFFPDPADLGRRYPQAARLSGKQAWAFLPLTVSGTPIGCCILSYERPHDFTADERAVLTSLAGLIAQAVDRARLYDTQHALATHLQQALLPRSLPHVPGLHAACRYLPATHGAQIGGDFYDLIRLGDRTAAAVIGDVQGHDATAAALMGQVRTAIHSHATAGATPAQVLTRTNRVLADLDPDLLVSCLYAHLDLDARRLDLAGAGHVPPLMGHGRSAGVLPVEPGPLLGIDTAAAYPGTTVPLPPGTLLALYTDGLVELPGTDLQHATTALTDCLTDHLAGHLADGPTADCDQDLDRLIDDLVHRNWPAGRHTDDIALLLLRTHDHPSP
ncbi:SpoIIE family protein phosphatase [Kitasatospora sp. NBC_01539]|uniref:SpoIIE family protein phosphatase n=1 Tax=Kitasatospora sp. NBC_01539 TaxID=2903577 RepID=UPI00386013AA